MKGTLQPLPDDFSIFLLNSLQSMAMTVLGKLREKAASFQR
jgi:hypothetical protein